MQYKYITSLYIVRAKLRSSFRISFDNDRAERAVVSDVSFMLLDFEFPWNRYAELAT